MLVYITQDLPEHNLPGIPIALAVKVWKCAVLIALAKQGPPYRNQCRSHRRLYNLYISKGVLN